jgi:alcohol dehydrogenase (cytochrome c)
LALEARIGGVALGVPVPQTRTLAIRWPVLLLVMLLSHPSLALDSGNDWPSYNRTLTSERFSPLATINTENANQLKVVCTYDTGEQMSFETGLVQADAALFATTEHDTISLDPNSCKQNWRVHEDFPSGFMRVNRGLAWLDGRVYRGTADGRVLAYDTKSGKRVWVTQIADAGKGESVPAAPIAWNGKVFIGMAGGDNKGVKGRMYALNAADGHIEWEFYMVPKETEDPTRGPQSPNSPTVVRQSWRNHRGIPITGGGTWTSYSLDPATGLLYVPAGNPAPDFAAGPRQGKNLFANSIVVLDAETGRFARHVQLVERDYHDWDVSGAPVLFSSQSGAHLMAATPKDGYLYIMDRDRGNALRREPVTMMLNEDRPFVASGTRFCPGSQGGAEWNGPAYDPVENTLLTGEVEWCTTVKVMSEPELVAVPGGQAWSGATVAFGTQDDMALWAGWMTATDADTGQKRWSRRTPFPILAGTTPTAGGVVFFGDMGGNFYVLNTKSGADLWSTNLGGALAGGVITYDTGAGQKVAVAAGMTSPIWPTSKVNGKVIVLGL